MTGLGDGHHEPKAVAVNLEATYFLAAKHDGRSPR